MLSYVIFASQLAGFGMVLYLVLRVALALRERETTSAPVAALAPDLRRDLADMISELRQAAEQINRNLAVRSEQIRQQLVDAELKIAVLEEAVQLAQVAAEEAKAIVGSERPEPLARGMTPGAPAEAPSGVAPEFRPLDLRDAGRYQQVFRLADEGLDTLEIARRTQLGREEVELVLRLRNEGTTP